MGDIWDSGWLELSWTKLIPDLGATVFFDSLRVQVLFSTDGTTKYRVLSCQERPLGHHGPKNSVIFPAESDKFASSNHAKIIVKKTSN